VDEADGRLLVRSNMPLRGDGAFAYTELQEALGRDLSRYREFVDVTVIDCVGERAWFSKEVAAFGLDADKEFPESCWPPYLHGMDVSLRRGDGSLRYAEGVRPGRIVWWPFEGLPEGEDPSIFLGSPGWNFAGLVDRLAGLFARGGSERVVLFHCTLGADRTGALHRGYLMGAKGMNLSEACRRSDSICGPPNADYARLSEAYWKTL